MNIATEHGKANRESLDVVVGCVEAVCMVSKFWGDKVGDCVIGLQVVDIGVEKLDGFELTSFGVLEVQRGPPVVTVVALDLGVCAFGFHELLAGGGHAKVASANDMMNVCGGFSWIDDRVGTRDGELLIGEAKNSKGALILGSDSSRSQDGDDRDEIQLHGGSSRSFLQRRERWIRL